MTIQEIASILDGNEYLNEVPKHIELIAKENKIVIVFGASDDLMEFRGAIYDELGVYNGGEGYIYNGNLLPEHPEPCECPFCRYETSKLSAIKIEAIWDSKEGFPWTYKTTTPHATFQILEDGEKYCKGIVFKLS